MRSNILLKEFHEAKGTPLGPKEKRLNKVGLKRLDKSGLNALRSIRQNIIVFLFIICTIGQVQCAPQQGWRRSLIEEGLHPHPGPELVIPQISNDFDKELFSKWIKKEEGKLLICSNNVKTMPNKWEPISQWPVDIIALQETRLSLKQQRQILANFALAS